VTHILGAAETEGEDFFGVKLSKRFCRNKSQDLHTA
jgi:hypothetical protein